MMKNITLRQYATLVDSSMYDSVLEHVNPVNSFQGGKMNINQMPYANVKYCIRIIQKVDKWEIICQLFEICFDVPEVKFWRAGVVEFFQAKKFMTDSFNALVQNEAKQLASKATDEHLWKMAGADNLRPFNDTLPLIQLGKLFGQYPFDLGRKPYSEVFSLLVQIKAQNEVESEYQKLNSK
jgi:hypothetical protein